MYKRRKKKDSYKNKHYKAIAEINKAVILEDSSPSSSAPSDKEAEFSPPAMKKLHSSPRFRKFRNKTCKEKGNETITG